MDCDKFSFGDQPIQIASFPCNQTRWFSLAPISSAMGYTRTSKAARLVDPQHVQPIGRLPVHFPKCHRKSLFVNVAGLEQMVTFNENGRKLAVLLRDMAARYNEPGVRDIWFVGVKLYDYDGEERSLLYVYDEHSLLLQVTDVFAGGDSSYAVAKDSLISVKQLSDRLVVPASSDVPILWSAAKFVTLPVYRRSVLGDSHVRNTVIPAILRDVHRDRPRRRRRSSPVAWSNRDSSPPFASAASSSDVDSQQQQLRCSPPRYVSSKPREILRVSPAPPLERARPTCRCEPLNLYASTTRFARCACSPGRRHERRKRTRDDSESDALSDTRSSDSDSSTSSRLSELREIFEKSRRSIVARLDQILQLLSRLVEASDRVRV